MGNAGVNIFVITYIEKIGLKAELEKLGFVVSHLDGNPILKTLSGVLGTSTEETEITNFIADYDPLNFAQSKAKSLAKEAASNARARYVSGGAGKDAEYSFKAQEAKQFDIDTTVGVFMQGRMNETGEAASTIAGIWNTNSLNWQILGGKIAGIEDKAINDINVETNWQNCIVIAKAAILVLDAI